MDPLDGTRYFLFDGNSNVGAISHHLQDSHKLNTISSLSLENEGQVHGGEKWDMRHSTGNVYFYVGDFFPQF